MSITIQKNIRDFVLQRGKFASVYNNQASFMHNNFRDEVYAIKSFLTNSQYKDQKLYIPINFPRLISHIYADFEVGEELEVVFEDEKVAERWNELKEDIGFNKVIYDQTVKKSYMGYSILKVRKDSNDTIRLDKIPNVNYFPDTTGAFLGSRFDDIERHTIVSTVKEERETITYIESYQKVATGWLTTYEKHKHNFMFRFDEQSIIEVMEGSGTIIEHMPLVICNNDLLEDEKEESEPYHTAGGYTSGGIIHSILGVSDYVDIIDLNQELNDRQTQISVEFIKHLTSKMSLPESFIKNLQQRRARIQEKAQRRGETISNDQLDMLATFEFITHKDGERPAHYITKDNHLLNSALEEKREIMRNISALSRIPKKFFGVEEKSGNNHVETGNQEFELFYKRIAQKRVNTKRVIKKIVQLILHYQGIKEQAFSVSFKKLQIKNIQQVSETMIALFTSGLVSKKTALAQTFDWDAKRVEEEISMINDDISLQTAIEGPTTSLFDNASE